MGRLMWLPEVLRDAGLVVHEFDGWRERGRESYEPIGLIIHETQGSAHSQDRDEIRVLAITGSDSAPAPIAQLYLSRTGEWTVVGSGRCNHALTGFGGALLGKGNSSLLGIEAAHAQGETWQGSNLVQYRSYVRGVAAILRHTGWPVEHVVGHKEHQPGDKSDPGFDMAQFRRDVAAAIAEEGDFMEEIIPGIPNEQVFRDLWHWMSGLVQGKDGADTGDRFKFPNAIKAGFATHTTANEALRTEVAALRNAVDELRAMLTPPAAPVSPALPDTPVAPEG